MQLAPDQPNVELRRNRAGDEIVVLAFPYDAHNTDYAPFQQRLVDVADGRLVALPDDLHNLQLLAGEGRTLPSHTNCLVLIELLVKGER